MDAKDKKFLEVSTLYARYRSMLHLIDELEVCSEYRSQINEFEKQVKRNLMRFVRKPNAPSIFDEWIDIVRANRDEFLKRLEREKSNLDGRQNILLNEISGYTDHQLPANLIARHQKGGKGYWIVNWYLYEVARLFKVGSTVRWKDMVNYLDDKRRYPSELKQNVPISVIIRRVSRFKKYVAKNKLPKTFKIKRMNPRDVARFKNNR